MTNEEPAMVSPSTGDLLKRIWNWSWPAAASIAAVAALLWGSGVLMRPNLVLSTAAVDLKIPTKFKTEMFLLRMLLERPGVADQMEEDIVELLGKAEIPPARAKAILAGKNIELEPWEQNSLDAAAAKVMPQMQNKILENLELPEAVLFLELRNTGRSSARQVDVFVELRGRLVDSKIETAEKLGTKEEGGPGNEFRLTFERLAPGSLVRTTIWYSKGSSQKKANVVTVIHDHGTLVQEATEGSVALGWQ